MLAQTLNSTLKRLCVIVRATPPRQATGHAGRNATPLTVGPRRLEGSANANGRAGVRFTSEGTPRELTVSGNSGPPGKSEDSRYCTVVDNARKEATFKATIDLLDRRNRARRTPTAAPGGADADAASGQLARILDAAFVTVPSQRHTRREEARST